MIEIKNFEMIQTCTRHCFGGVLSLLLGALEPGSLRLASGVMKDTRFRWSFFMVATPRVVVGPYQRTT